MTDVTLYATGGAGLASPIVGPEGVLYATSSQSGEILAVTNSGISPVVNTSGMPTALAFADGTMYICDHVHQAILRRGTDGSLSEFVREYEAKDFKGPSALVVDSKGNMFFTDSGPMGETTLQAPRGSVYTISRDGQLLQPLILESLAHPCGLALGPNDSSLFVCEMMANRVLRLIQRPMGVWHCSVYFQFSGGLGPAAVACDSRGFLYVALHDFSFVGNKGKVVVISPDGAIVRQIACPAPELSGIALDPAGKTLFITESSTNSVFTVAI